MNEFRLDLTVQGKVQGVRFRVNARNEARKLGITGYVQNLPENIVHIVAEGEKSKLNEFLYWCIEGPVLAKVEHLSFDWLDGTGEFTEFVIIRDKEGFLIDQLKAFSIIRETEISLPEGTVVPQHIAIIPDGNRRWARQRGLHTLEGHKRGFDNLIELTRASRRLGIKYLTVWGFSTENWYRPKEEVKYLMDLFVRLLKKYEKDLHEDKVRFRHLGRKDRLDKRVLDSIARVEDATKDYTAYYLNVALDYGGRDEILRGISRLAETDTDLKHLSAEKFGQYLDTQGCPDPDLIIRTSGELRLSGLMPWQAAYSELYFATVHFPDFDANEFKKAILEYSHRNRRFGK